MSSSGSSSPLAQFEFALGCLSLLGSICIIASFIFFRELRKHPLSIICWAALSDFIFVFTILLKDATGDDLCFLRPYGFCVSTFVIHTFGLAGVSWAGGALSVKVLVNTVRPFASTTKLQKWFHLFIWIFCILMSIVSWRRQDGSIDDDRCAKTKTERVHAEFYVPVIIYFVLSVISFGSAVSRMRALQEAAHYRSKVVLRLLAYVIALPICWLGPLVYRFYISSAAPSDRDQRLCENLNTWKTVSLNLLGLVNAIIWISSPDFRRTIAARYAAFRCCHHSMRSKAADSSSDLEDGQELDGQDINQIALVLRNNMLTCSLIGIREGLKRLRVGRRGAKLASGASRLAERAPLGSIAGISVTDSIISDVAASDASADETASDIDTDNEELPIVEAAVESNNKSSSSSTTKDYLYQLRRGHYFSSDTFAVQPQSAAAQNQLDSSQIPLFSSSFVCTVFCGRVFHNLRMMSGMTSQDFEHSIAPNVFLQGVDMKNDKMSQGGASGAFFAKSPCKRFILKTIPVEEADALLSALPWYYEHLTKYPKSLLCRILGLYRIVTPFNTLHVLVMSNLFGHHPSLRQAAPTRVYDLKGSWIDRTASAGAPVLKDVDLGRSTFQMPAAKRQHLIRQLNEDSKLLRDLGIMDYSLLLGVFDAAAVDLEKSAIPYPSGSVSSSSSGSSRHVSTMRSRSQERIDIIQLSDGKTVLVLGVIDMLQPWNASKKFESFFKSRVLRKDPKGISAIEPKSYSKRFRSAMANLFQ